ncbi:uncharacterized protein LOC127256995 [Andrographis paniculata]|uniref:uncharacterized protein LOC127256995 n=1 Tax=Andrographis paniculata TaxID=175694 RepID=UPI0021E7D4BF|nr:uncharacterized protein LOC127256995 [Andrographis paniculata]
MDLWQPPPPPPPPPFHYPDRDHLRYRNLLQPPDFAPIPLGAPLPPPQFCPPIFRYPLPPSPTLPPPPPPPGGYIERQPISPPVNFSSPYRPIVGRGDRFEFGLRPEPYLNRDDYPLAPPPPIPRWEDTPSRFMGEYSERNPILRNEVLFGGSRDHHVRDLPPSCGQDFYRDAIERRGRVLDIGNHERYRDSHCYSSEMIKKREDVNMRGDDRNDDWGRRWDCDNRDPSLSLCRERGYDERRWGSRIFDRDGDQGRWNNGTSHWDHAQGSERACDDCMRNRDIINQDHAMCSGRDYNAGRDLYREGFIDERRWKYVGSEGAPFAKENRQLGCLEDDLHFGRFSGRLERTVGQEEFIRSKKRRLQNKNTSHSRGYKWQHGQRKSSNGSVKVKDEEGSEQTQKGIEEKAEEVQDVMDLAISFKSNALIGKAIMVPPGTAENSNCNSRMCSDKIDDTGVHSCEDGLVMSENYLAPGPSEVEVSIEGDGMSKTPESNTLELQEDKCFPVSHKLSSSPEADSSLIQKPGNVIILDESSGDADCNEVSEAQDNTLQVGGDNVMDIRSLDGTDGTDFLNVSIDVSPSLDSPLVGDKANVTKYVVSSLDGERKKLSSDGDDNIEESREESWAAMTCLSPNCPSVILGNMKATVAQMGLAEPETNLVVDTFGPIGGEVEGCLKKNPVPAAEGCLVGEKDYIKEESCLNQVPCRIEYSTPEINFGPDGSLHGHWKNIKLATPRPKLSSLSDDDTIADGVASDYSVLGQESSTKLAEQGAAPNEGPLSASEVVNECGPMDVECRIGNGTAEVSVSDEILDDADKSRVKDDLFTFANNISLCADRKGHSASNSDNELLESSFEMRSCMSSPEGMPSYTGFSRNCGPRTAAPRFFSLGKSIGKAVSENLSTNSQYAATSTEGDEVKVMEKSNILCGKLISNKNQLTSAAPKLFPSRQPISSARSRILHSPHVTKSRTWHRTGNSNAAVTEPKVKPGSLPPSHGTKTTGAIGSSYIRKGNSLVRKPSPSRVTVPGCSIVSNSSVYKLTPCIVNLKNTEVSNSKTVDTGAPTQLRIEPVNMCRTSVELPPSHDSKVLTSTGCNLGESFPLRNSHSPNYVCPKSSESLDEAVNTSVVTEYEIGPVNNSDSHSAHVDENSRKRIIYVKRRSNQLIASSCSSDTSTSGVDKPQAHPPSDSYFKSKKYQLVRASPEDHERRKDANVNPSIPDSYSILNRTSRRRQSGIPKDCRSSKFSLVWKLHDTSSEKRKKVLGPRKAWPQMFTWKKVAPWRSFIHALGTRVNGSSYSIPSSKLLLSRKRGAIYKRSARGYSVRISKILSVGGASLKWSKSMERNSKKTNEEATRAVAAAEKRKKEEKEAAPVASKTRTIVSRERIFRIGSERYRMDPTRRTLHRITDAETESSSVVEKPAKDAKRSYVPRRLFIDNDEYVRIGNGNKLVRDPKKLTRYLASEKVRWSLRTARLRMARKRKYCQFFTRFGKCNKDDGKCPYIHDPSKIAVCTKFLNSSCSTPDCKLTHKVIPERMQDCSYFLKGLCSNENCPYRHVKLNPDSAVCESFLRGYCTDGNECPKKHTYVCPAYEATGMCPQVSTCKLHHPKKKPDKKPTPEQKVVRGRYFDGGLVGDCSFPPVEELSTKGTNDIVWHDGKFPDYISLEVSDDEMNTHPDAHTVELKETDHNHA